MLFAQLLEEHYGCKPMIYASSSYFNNYLGPSFKSYPLFIARYSKSEPQLSYGAKWILWQFSDRGRIDGIDALVDLSRFNKGYSVKDISYKGNKTKKRRRDNGEVPRPKVKHPENREVPLSPRQRQEMQNRNVEKTEAQKRGEENERKRQKLEEEKRRKEEAKRAEEKRKADEKRRKEEEKRRKEIEKKQKELEKKRQEEAKKQQDAAAKQAREQAQERMRREKERAAEIERDNKARLDRERKDELERAKQERIEKQKREEAAKKSSSASKASSTYKPKGNNQSSADNDEIRYNTKNKKGTGKD